VKRYTALLKVTSYRTGIVVAENLEEARKLIEAGLKPPSCICGPDTTVEMIEDIWETIGEEPQDG
jgi:hypothetical protein